jgi:hypothetical protein
MSILFDLGKACKGLRAAMIFLLIFLLVFGLLLLPVSIQKICWDGGTPLEITFVVTDADSGQPIANAKIEVIHQEYSFCEPRMDVPFTLLTDRKGIAKYFAKVCPCSGTETWTQNTFVVYLPGWHIQFSAHGYVRPDIFFLDEPEQQKRVQRRHRNEPTRLKVPIQLHSLPARAKGLN